MNTQLHQQVLAKSDLERLVLSYLRMLPGSQHIERVQVAPTNRARRNWTVTVIEPSLSTTADNQARSAISELQREFRLPEG